jgi:hypothetical protein
MRESRMYGSVRGAPSNGRPYRDPISDIGRPADVSMLSSRDREQSGGRVAGQWRFTYVRDPRYVSWRTFSLANAQVSLSCLGT